MKPVSRLSLLSWLWLAGLAAAPQAQAQGPSAAAPASLRLKPSSGLQEKYDADATRQLPTYIESDRLQGRTDLETRLEGKVQIRRGGLLIRADAVDYDQTRDEVRARGNVYLNREGNIYQGDALDLQLEAFEGFFTQPQYRLSKNQLNGQAERVEFVDSGTTVMHKASLTSCQRKPGPSWVPDWFFRGDKITLDTDRNLGVAEGASLVFKGVPILPVPSVDFPLNEARKTGLLPPTLGVDNIGGLEYTQPYYINLAPNRDVTLAPTYWSRRGIKLGSEFRYLEGLGPLAPFAGIARLDFMDRDQLRNGEQRWGVALNHTGVIDPRVAGGTLGLNVNLNRVSDDNYWKDFTATNTSGVQRLLSNDVQTSWASQTVQSRLTVQRWQTLQDLADPSNATGSRITPPFDRVPQLALRYQPLRARAGFDLSLEGQLTRFESNRNSLYDKDQPNCAYGANCNGSRLVSVAQLSRPFVTPYGYLTPKVQAIGRSYQFDQALANGLTTATVTTPSVSLDTGMVFERAVQLLGRNWTQTLEPRAFYVYTPFREQNFLPNYDSGSNGYNFASIFTENTFGGYDRVSDSRLLTLGASSRFIHPETGAEAARFAIAQRLRMKQEHVVLNPLTDAAPAAGLNDVLVSAGLNLTRVWGVDSAMQYNPKTNNPQRRMIAGRYNPGSYRVISAGYRTQNNDDGSPYSRQLDLGWQWPLHDLWRGADEDLGIGRGLGEGRWYSVARLNYSGLDRKFVESVIGFEYDAGCWLGRVVTERQIVAEGVTRQRLLFQLEFAGFSRLGTNAIGSMRNNVPGYMPLRAPALPPSRFGHYD